MAAAFGLPEIVKYVLERGGDINKISSQYNYNALHFISVGIRSSKPEETIKVLVENRIDLEARDVRGRTPLLLAILFGKLPIVKYLLLHNANLYASDIKKHMAMHLCLMDSNKSNFELFKFLLELNCNPNVLTTEKYTPLHFLAVNGSIKNKILMSKMLLEHGANFKAVSEVGDTILHVAARCRSNPFSFLYFLLKNGVDSCALNAQNETFLSILNRSDPQQVFKFLKQFSLEEITGEFEFGVPLRDFISLDLKFSVYYQLCKDELRTLQEIKIHPEVTFSVYQILTFNLKKCAAMCRNEKIMSRMKNFRYSSFGVYGADLKRKFLYGKKLWEDQKSCLESLSGLFGDSLNFYAIADIMDLYNMKETPKLKVKLGKLSNDFELMRVFPERDAGLKT